MRLEANPTDRNWGIREVDTAAQESALESQLHPPVPEPRMLARALKGYPKVLSTPASKQILKTI